MRGSNKFIVRVKIPINYLILIRVLKFYLFGFGPFVEV